MASERAPIGMLRADVYKRQVCIPLGFQVQDRLLLVPDPGNIFMHGLVPVSYTHLFGVFLDSCVIVSQFPSGRKTDKQYPVYVRKGDPMFQLHRPVLLNRRFGGSFGVIPEPADIDVYKRQSVSSALVGTCDHDLT